MKKSRFLALLMVLAMVISCFSGRVEVRADGDNAVVAVGGASTLIYTMAAGETRHVIIPVRLASWEYTVDTASIIVMVESDDNLFEPIEAVLTRENVPTGDLVGLNSYQTTNVEFDLKVNDTATIGPHSGKVNFYLSGVHYTEYETKPLDPTQPSVIPFTIRINKAKAPAQLVVDNFVYDERTAVVGSNFIIDFDVKNAGEIAALDTYMSVDYSSASGIIPDYSIESIKIGDLTENASKHQKLSLRILPTAEPGMKQITVEFTHVDADGKKTEGIRRTVYINVVSDSTAEPEDAKLTVQSVKLNDEIEVDNPYNVVVSVENVGKETAKNIVAQIEEGVGETSKILPDYATVGIEVGDLKPGEKKEVTLPVYVTKSAAAGLNELKVKVNYENSKGNIQSANANVYLTTTVPEKQEVKNDVSISQMTQSPAAPMPGDILTLDFVVTNSGSDDISELTIYGSELSSNSFEPLTADARHKVGNLAVGESQSVTMQFKLGSAIPEGMNVLKLIVSYTDADGVIREEDKPQNILNVTKQTEEQLKNSIEITNISQSPANPMVGENVTVSFTVENKGTKAITDMKFSGTNLGSSGFEPISSEVYKRVGTIEAGSSKNVSMTFKLGENIQEGFNTLSLAYSYRNANDEAKNDETAIYILNVQKKEENSSVNSRPKLIVESFTLSEEELRAGSTFDFTFVLRNTHASKAAKNITVTVMQANDVFSATRGSNSFYIDAIQPGGTAENTINLKVKSDTATGSYDLTIKVGYEYEDMSQADVQTGGVTEDLPVKLQAIENSRPALQNLSVGYGWDTPTVNQSTTLMFDFYNMGRSSLNNVYVTMESDYFQFEVGTSAIIGTVSAGMSSYQEISITPIMEGMGTGKLIVHFEDSNGDEVTQEFEIPQTYIQGEPDYNWGGDDYNPGGWDNPVGGNDIVEPKKPLLPVWAYVLCLVGALVVGTFATRGIMIKVYKKKHFGDEM